MSTAKVTSKGQITLPLEVRKRLNLEVGDRVEFVELAEGGYALKPAVEDVRSLKGMLRKRARPVSTDDMREAIRRRGSGK
jgi:looped-hinge helix DNA binding domain, AbrB family